MFELVVSPFDVGVDSVVWCGVFGGEVVFVETLPEPGLGGLVGCLFEAVCKE